MSRVKAGRASPRAAAADRSRPESAFYGAERDRPRSAAVRVTLAAGLAGALTALLWRSLPKHLDVRTDVVGYPIYANFNVDRYFWRYWLVVLFFPLATIALDLLFARIGARRFPGAARRPRPEAATPAWRLPAPARSASWTVFLAFVVGLESSVAAGTLAALPLAAATFALTAGAGAFAISRARAWPLSRSLAAANALLAPLTVLGLWLVSRSTDVVIVGDGVRDYDWLPLWLAAAGAAAIVVAVALALHSMPGGEHAAALERRVGLLVAGPIALFLFLAWIPGAGGPIDFFHEGETLAAARLTDQGAFPWRDLIFIHGLLQDVASPLVGLAVFENSRWGAAAGGTVLVMPLYWISLYFLCVYLFGRNLLFLLATQLAVVLGLVQEAHLRYALMPFVLLLLAAVLRRPTAARALGLAALLVFQTVVSPETAFAMPACVTVLAAFELVDFRRGRPLAQAFRRTLLVAGGALAVAVLAFAFLAANGALDDFLFYYRTFAADHQLTGGLPVTWTDNRFRFAAAAPVVLVVAAIFYAAYKLRARRPIEADDWVIAAATLVAFAYYHKFLARADAHVYQSYAAAIPVLFYALYKLVSAAERKLALEVPAVTALVVVAVLAASPRSLAEATRAVPGQLEVEVARAPTIRAAGYVQPGAIDRPMLADLRTVIGAFLQPGDALFDFSNNPGLFHYLLDRPAATRYYHVSMAIRRHTQADLIDQLKASRPKLVVFTSKGFGLPSWDQISNSVRHYDVSEYLLRQYRPVLASHGFLFFARRDLRSPALRALGSRLHEPPETSDPYFFTTPCDWGFAPDFLATAPRADVRGRPVPFRDIGGVYRFAGWAVDLGVGKPAVAVVATVNARVIARTEPIADRADVAKILGSENFQRSGFALDVTKASVARLATVADPAKVRLYAVARSGQATELSYGVAAAHPDGPQPKRLTFADGRELPIVPRAGGGAVDFSGVAAQQTIALHLPRQLLGRGSSWLRIETGRALHPNAFALTDDLARPDHSVHFKTLGGDRSVAVHVGACSQWHGYRSRQTFLVVNVTEDVRRIELLR